VRLGGHTGAKGDVGEKKREKDEGNLALVGHSLAKRNTVKK